jgi:hypothetical protein
MVAKGRQSHPHRLGAENPRAKLTDSEVNAIRQLYKSGLRERAIQQQLELYHVTPSLIGKIGRCEHWNHTQ